ncbi:acetate--CoA ligase family protein [Methanosarcina sp. KYL-1]|uniref:acetate--CoA ligase family protein n=1 Tax=Methanosarcina sp. KYL-1 TaxID=2602068 RepID=UPI002101B351|nr:acetate--CoA ligase family protein [Methanosarcina sp. KYL-1]MCQ1536505.1 acetate--CoA ligase family protein [Methanosarcina sp. KYL-1]
MNSTDISFFFNPRSIALVGASPKPSSLSYTILESLEKIGFEGKIYPINPRYEEIGGLKCYASLADINDTIDIAVLSVPAPGVIEVMKEEFENVRGAVVVSSGFKEIKGEGEKLEAELKRLAEAKGIRVIGPNCLGIYDTVSKVDTFFISRERARRPGRGGLSILTQSGSFASMIVDEIASEGIGVARIVSYGNKVDVDEADCLEFLAEDEATKYVVLYVESVEDGKRFLEVASRCAQKKPVVAVKVGKKDTGVRATASHTGAAASRYEAYEAAFRKAGIIEVDGYEELKDACRVLNSYTPGRGDRILVITNGGGIGIGIVDACESRGLSVPQLSEEQKAQLSSKLPSFASVGNPIDITGNGWDEHYAVALREGFGEEYDIAIVAVLWGPPLLNEGIIDKLKAVADECGKPVLICSPGGNFTRKMSEEFEKKGLPVFATPESAARAAAILSGGKKQNARE